MPHCCRALCPECASGLGRNCGFSCRVINVDKQAALEHVSQTSRRILNNWMTELIYPEDQEQCLPLTADELSELQTCKDRHLRQAELDRIFKAEVGKSLGSYRRRIHRRIPASMLPVWEEWSQIDVDRERWSSLERAKDAHRHSVYAKEVRSEQRERLARLVGHEDAPLVISVLAHLIQRQLHIDTERDPMTGFRHPFFAHVALIDEAEAEHRQRALHLWLSRDLDLAPQAPCSSRAYEELHFSSRSTPNIRTREDGHNSTSSDDEDTFHADLF